MFLVCIENPLGIQKITGNQKEIAEFDGVRYFGGVEIGKDLKISQLEQKILTININALISMLNLLYACIFVRYHYFIM